MATFNGTTGADTINADTGVISGGVTGGGTLAELQDLIGDTIFGNAGADTLVAGDGNDNIRGSGGADSIDGGGGTDDLRYDTDALGVGGTNGVIVNLSEVTYSGGAVSVNAHRARDGFLTFDTVLDMENVRGTRFVDHLIGGDTLNGSSANDGFEGFRGLAGADVIKGGTGYDEVRYDLDASNLNTAGTANGTGGVTVNLVTGTATDGFGDVDSLENIEGARGTETTDQLIGNDEDNKFFGLGGNDTITLGRGFDYVEPGAGNDVVNGDAGVGFEGSYEDRDQVSYDDFGTNGIGVFIDLNLSTLVDPTGGIDTISDIERLSGTTSNDTLIGADFVNQREEMFRGLAGNDIIDGRNGYDIADYSRDAFQTTPGNAGVAINLSTAAVVLAGFGTVQAGTARDGFGNTDTLYYIEGGRGTAQADVFIGGAGNEQYRIMGGNDTFDGGAGLDGVEMFVDSIFTGPGAIVNLSSTSFTHNAITVLANNARGIDGGTTTLSNVENATGSAADDAIRGSDGRNFLNGWFGDDTLYGMGDNDVINGLEGANSMYGGDGTDTVSFMYDATVNSYHLLNYPDQGFTTWGGVNVNLGTLSAVGIDGQTNVVDGFENVTGTFVNDTMVGDGNANSFRGLSGNDNIDGAGGVDTINYSPTNQDGRILVPLEGVNYSEPNIVRVNLHSGALTLGGNVVAAGTAEDGDGGIDTLSNIENVIGSIGDDFIAASLTANVIDGWTGTNDTVVLQGVAADYSITQPAGTGQYQVVRLADTNDTDLLSNVETIVFTGGGTLSLAAAGVNSAGSGLDDELVGANGGDTLNGGVGADLVDGGTGGDDLAGGTGNDELNGGAGDDIVNGGDDNDTIIGGSGEGDDTYVGGTGIDTAIYTSASLSLTIDLEIAGNPGTGAGTAVGSEIGTDQLTEIENVVGGQGGDAITGDGQANGLSGVAGADQLAGEGGNDTLQGGSGNDTLMGGADADQLFGDSNDDNLKGGAGDDYVDGGANGVNGGDTADFSDATGAVVVSLGADGDAVVTATGIGTDTIVRIEHLIGGSVGDVLVGNAGANVLSGGDGNDTLKGGVGNDLLVGGANTAAGDTADLSDATGAIVFTLGAAGDGVVSVVGIDTDTLSGIENLIGGSAGDTLVGNAAGNALAGGGGGDQLDGGEGDDTLRGGVGNDLLSGGGNTAGGDTADFSDATGALVFALGAGGDGVVSAAGIDTDTLSGIENLIGGSAGDDLTGNNAGNAIGGSGGNDTLPGGLGIDTMTGGIGEDMFHFALAALENGGSDHVSDYTPGLDSIKLFTNVQGDTVSTSGGNAVVTFGNGYQMNLTGSAGQVIRLDFTDRLEYWDTGTNAAWSRYRDYLNGAGQISDQEIINDNGSLTQRHVDLSPGGTLHAWIEYTDYYSAAPHTLTDQEIRYDNGTIGQRHLNQAGTLEYTDYVTPGAVLLDQEVINLNGTREQRHYDPSDTRSAQWSSYIDYFNASSPAQLTAKSMIYDPGAFTHGTFGAVHQTQWEYAVAGDTSHGVARYYNAANVLLGQELF